MRSTGGISTAHSRRLRFVLTLFACLSVAVHAEPRHKQDRLLVKVKSGRSKETKDRVLAAAGALEQEVIPRLEYRVVKVRPERLDETLAQLKADPDVETVEKDYLGQQADLPNDPVFLSGKQWHLATVQATAAWDVTQGSSDILVAVIDSGIDPAQADLVGQTVTGYNCFDDSTDVTDTVNGHGTMTAGIVAAAANNSLGVASVASGCRILPVKAIDSTGYISWADAAKGIIHATDRGAKVINMSFSGPAGSTVLKNAIDYAWNRGVVLVAAAGNHSSSAPEYPAAYPKVVSVAATQQTDALCSFSNYGSTIKLTAPGQNVWTTVLNGNFGPTWGTSMSSPIVAGVFALAFSLNDSLSNADAVELVQSNADDLGAAGYDEYFGHGRVNALRSVEAARGVVPGPTPEVIAPVPDGAVAGTVAVEIAVPDTSTVTKVECYLDGQLESTTTTLPAQFLWDTRQQENGTHVLQSKAYDAEGHVGTSASVPVLVQNPSASLTVNLQAISPLNGTSLIKPKLKLLAALSDTTGIGAVQFYVDGQLIHTDKKAPYKCSWNSRFAAAGAHLIEAVAVDLMGNEVASDNFNVTK